MAAVIAGTAIVFYLRIVPGGMGVTTFDESPAVSPGTQCHEHDHWRHTMDENKEVKDIDQSQDEKKAADKTDDSCCCYVVDACGCYVDPCCYTPTYTSCCC